MTPPLVVGNWKMNGGPGTWGQLARDIASGLTNYARPAQVVLAPPFLGLVALKQTIAQEGLYLAAQNCHWEDAGAFTGEVSPAMLAEIGCDFVIIGHSERRHLFAETDETIAKKLASVFRHRMRPILCIGETLEQRQSDRTQIVIAHQVDSALKGVSEGVIEMLEIAYEPVWAIGTGLNADAKQISDAHRQIRYRLGLHFGRRQVAQTRILYGGSVKPENSRMIAGIDQVSGVLVGGASLAPDSFLEIVQAFAG